MRWSALSLEEQNSIGKIDIERSEVLDVGGHQHAAHHSGFSENLVVRKRDQQWVRDNGRHIVPSRATAQQSRPRTSRRAENGGARLARQKPAFTPPRSFCRVLRRLGYVDLTIDFVGM